MVSKIEEQATVPQIKLTMHQKHDTPKTFILPTSFPLLFLMLVQYYLTQNLWSP